MAPTVSTVAAVGNRLQPAWLLHRRPFRNTSLTLELLTPGHGRVAAVARGGRRSPLLSPFVPLWVELKPAGEMYTLRHSEGRDGRPQLAGKALYCGFYLNELITRLLHRDDPQPLVWTLYEQTLAALAEPLPLDVVLRRFELSLLDELGYGIALGYDINGAPLDPDGHYQLDPEQGLLAGPGGYRGSELLAIAAGDWQPAARKTALQVCRALLAPHLGDKPLKSRELFRGK